MSEVKESTWKSSRFYYFIKESYVNSIRLRYSIEDKLKGSEATKEKTHLQNPQGRFKSRVHPTALVDDRTVEIGDDCEIGPFVVIHKNTKIGNRVHIAAGTIVGSQGYVCKGSKKRTIEIRHRGGVVIKDGARIGSFNCIDKSKKRGDATVIGRNSNVSDHIHVAHDVKIGENCHIGTGAMLGGHSVINDDAVVGPNASISNRIVVGARARIKDGSVVTKDIEPSGDVSGNFAIGASRHRTFIGSVRGDGR